jgi:hypothetical protein
MILKDYAHSRLRAALTSMDVIALCSAIFVALIAIYIIAIYQMNRPRGAKRIPCVNNLKNVGLAARIYATDNNDQFPGVFLLTNGPLSSLRASDYFLMLSNQLSSPKLLHCPEDKKRTPLQTFEGFSNQNISYFVNLTADETKPDVYLAGHRNLVCDGKSVPTGPFRMTTNQQLGWSKEMHAEQGMIVMGDGSVQQFSNHRFRRDLRDRGNTTNLLLIP